MQDRYYGKKYMNHDFLHAINLHTITLENRQKCTFDFSLFLLQSVDNKKVTFIIPEKFEQAKTILKRDDEDTVVINNNLTRLVPSHINRFFNSKQYHVWKNDFRDDNTVEASEIINSYGSKLVESVVILKIYWFFMTSFSTFIHNNPQIDDCADLSKVGYQEKAVAFIRRKTRFGKYYLELTLRFGYVELLATSGFFGSLDGAFFRPFFESSIHEPPTAITASFQTFLTAAIFIANDEKEYICKNRILNQYYKLTSKNNWEFYSKCYEDNDFSPANPLYFKSSNIMYSAASLVIRSFAYQEVNRKDMNQLIPKILSLDDSSFNSVNKFIKKYLLFLNQHGNSSFSSSPIKVTKKELIEIYNTSLANGLKYSNIKYVKSAKKRYN